MSRRRWIVAVVFVVLVAAGVGLYEAVERVRETAGRTSCDLGQLGLAFHLYADNHGGIFPPAAVCDAQGRRLLSWRVLLLPYLEQDNLFKQFRMNEPWDSEHNLRLVERMPKTYEAKWQKYVAVPPNHTVLHVFVGPNAAFDWATGRKPLVDYPDGTSNTLLYVEAGEPVPWTKPDEIELGDGPLPRLRGLFRDGFRSGTVDGTGYLFIRHDYDQAVFRASVTRNGKEMSDPIWLFPR